MFSKRRDSRLKTAAITHSKNIGVVSSVRCLLGVFTESNFKQFRDYRVKGLVYRRRGVA
jgi:hypothetical protein